MVGFEDCLQPLVINDCPKLVCLSHKKANREISNILKRNNRRSGLVIVDLVHFCSEVKVLELLRSDDLSVVLDISHTHAIRGVALCYRHSCLIQVSKRVLLGSKPPVSIAGHRNQLTQYSRELARCLSRK